MEEEGALKSIIQCCGNRVHTWNNKDSSSVNKLNKLLKDLKETQRMSENSMERSQSEKQDEKMTGKPEQDQITSDEMIEHSDAHKRHTKDTIEPLVMPYEFRVLVLGMAGVGKTSTIKTLLGNDNEIKSSKDYTTKKSEFNFKFIDSPGIKEDTEVISQYLSSLTPRPHVIMIVIRVGQVTKKTFEMIDCIHACIDKPKKRTMIIFSGKDVLENKGIEEYIKETPDLEHLVNMYGKRFQALNNKDTSDQTQVNQLLEKITEIYHEYKEKRKDHKGEKQKSQNPNDEGVRSKNIHSKKL
ncbi:hypothetical protein QQF64_000889 [Cirrhinus molitorella]|uniref:AIG1-type G domain-containing protein n=1 Tax=Cirrhinus molitorella TaxID=172907 RepID=A0ABR3NYN2_9TELE